MRPARRTPRRTARSARGRSVRALLACTALLLAALPATTAAAQGDGERAAEPRPLDQIVPAPVSAEPKGDPYTLGEETAVRLGEGTGAQTAETAEQLAGVLRPSTGYEVPVVQGAASDEAAADAGIELRLDAELAEEQDLGKEGYRLDVDAQGVRLAAGTDAGLFHGVQTLRQLLPAQVESDEPQDGPWQIAGGTVLDKPRYAYRSAMLDIARHFFDADQVKRYVDQLAQYKVNTLHLHLSDDQGWRLAIDSWPRLTEHGGSTEVGGGEGGYLTKDDYREILSYAADRQITVVPEIDMPGHTTAALSSYAELNCDGVAPPLYTGTDVGFSSLCVPLERTYDFVDDVVREIAELTPGPYLHIGGDEADATDEEEYAAFMERAQGIVAKYGKTVVGWQQIVAAEQREGTVAQYWGTKGDEEDVAEAARNGTPLIMSPASHAYIDMKYTEDTELGNDWAALIEVQDAYDWDPASFLKGAPADSVLGVEAPMWTETLSETEHIEYLAFPRLPGIAELGWSPASTHDWEDYRVRLAQQGPRWEALGVEYYRSPQVPWDAASG